LSARAKGARQAARLAIVQAPPDEFERVTLAAEDSCFTPALAASETQSTTAKMAFVAAPVNAELSTSAHERSQRLL